MSTQKHQASFVQSVVRQALEIKKAPLPWGRAVGAGISLGLPSLIGLLMGRFDYGLLAGTGGFTYLYASSEPYFIRSKNCFSRWRASLFRCFAAPSCRRIRCFPDS